MSAPDVSTADARTYREELHAVAAALVRLWRLAGGWQHFGPDRADAYWREVTPTHRLTRADARRLEKHVAEIKQLLGECAVEPNPAWEARRDPAVQRVIQEATRTPQRRRKAS